MSIAHIRSHFENHRRVIALVAEELSESIEQCSAILTDALRQGNKLLIMGNGGSAADAQHFAAELVGRFLRERRALPAIALTTDTSVLTAIANDYGYDQVFRRQVEGLAVPGDVVVGISTSGNSNNVQQGLILAKELGCRTVGLLGRDGGSIGQIVDINLTVPVQETPFVQEAHLTIIHLLCDLVESQFAPVK